MEKELTQSDYFKYSIARARYTAAEAKLRGLEGTVSMMKAQLGEEAPKQPKSNAKADVMDAYRVALKAYEKTQGEILETQNKMQKIAKEALPYLEFIQKIELDIFGIKVEKE